MTTEQKESKESERRNLPSYHKVKQSTKTITCLKKKTNSSTDNHQVTAFAKVQKTLPSNQIALPPSLRRSSKSFVRRSVDESTRLWSCSSSSFRGKIHWKSSELSVGVGGDGGCVLGKKTGGRGRLGDFQGCSSRSRDFFERAFWGGEASLAKWF